LPPQRELAKAENPGTLSAARGGLARIHRSQSEATTMGVYFNSFFSQS
jgi:hypothetical protein